MQIWEPLASPSQEALIRAAFARDEQFEDAWITWRSLVEAGTVQRADYQLLQLLAPRLQDRASSDPYVALCCQQYRLTWAKAALTKRLSEPILATLHQAGVKVLVLKGLALSLLYYQDLGLRGMGDVDILVPEEQFRVAARTLQQKGWRSSQPDEHPDLRFVPAQTLVDDRGYLIDLHCRVFDQSLASENDPAFWRRAFPVEIGAQRVLALSPAHQILHLCVHGLNWQPFPPVRWIADCLTILSRGPIDWTEFTDCSERHALSPILLTGLDYLRQAFDAPVPADVLDRLRSAPIGQRRRRQLVIARSPRDRLSGMLEYHWLRLRGIAGPGLVRPCRLILPYCRALMQAQGHRRAGSWLRSLVRRYRMADPRVKASDANSPSTQAGAEN